VVNTAQRCPGLQIEPHQTCRQRRDDTAVRGQQRGRRGLLALAQQADNHLRRSVSDIDTRLPAGRGEGGIDTPPFTVNGRVTLDLGGGGTLPGPEMTLPLTVNGGV